MSEEDYDVIINDKEYKELKDNKNKVLQLQKKIQELRQNDDSKNLKLAKVEREVQVQREEISFLLGVVENIGSERKEGENQEIAELQHSGNSASYQILGESIMFPKKVNPKQSQLKSSDLVKKYSPTLQLVRRIEEKLESQEALIKKLNQMNSEKDELLLGKNTQKMLEMISEKAMVKISSLDQLKQIIAENKSLKEQRSASEVQLKEGERLKEEVNKLGQKCKQKSSENDKLKDEIKMLSQSINAFSDKLNKAESQIVLLKKSIKKEVPPVSSSFGDRPYRIKLLIDEHIKEMEMSLGNVGGLSSQEINAMLGSELKSLIDYVPKSMENKK